jgi:hypothetical protein
VLPRSCFSRSFSGPFGVSTTLLLAMRFSLRRRARSVQGSRGRASVDIPDNAVNPSFVRSAARVVVVRRFACQGGVDRGAGPQPAPDRQIDRPRKQASIDARREALPRHAAIGCRLFGAEQSGPTWQGKRHTRFVIVRNTYRELADCRGA